MTLLQRNDLVIRFIWSFFYDNSALGLCLQRITYLFDSNSEQSSSSEVMFVDWYYLVACVTTCHDWHAIFTSNKNVNPFSSLSAQSIGSLLGERQAKNTIYRFQVHDFFNTKGNITINRINNTSYGYFVASTQNVVHQCRTAETIKHLEGVSYIPVDVYEIHVDYVE